MNLTRNAWKSGITASIGGIALIPSLSSYVGDHRLCAHTFCPVSLIEQMTAGRDVAIVGLAVLVLGVSALLISLESKFTAASRESIKTQKFGRENGLALK